MAEEKKSTPKQVKSEFTVAMEVYETIAGIAASEIDGITSMSGGLVRGFAERLGWKNLSKGVSVEMDEETQSVSITVRVIVEYGRNIPSIFQHMVEHVQASVEGMTGSKVNGISMVVEGVSFPGEEDTPETLLLDEGVAK